MAMNGTSASQTFAMDWMPPRITTAVSTVMMIPDTQGEMCQVSRAMAEIEFAWTMLPMPKAATAVRNAKIMPSHFACRPRSSTYMGPPAMVPLAVTIRYFTESTASVYLVAIPNTPVSHIQSTAPGPPAATAVATPTMLPVPMVAANAVVSAPNWLTSPSPSELRWNEMRIAVPRYRWMNRKRKVRNRCVPTSRNSIGGPHTRSLTVPRSASIPIPAP